MNLLPFFSPPDVEQTQEINVRGQSFGESFGANSSAATKHTTKISQPQKLVHETHNDSPRQKLF